MIIDDIVSIIMVTLFLFTGLIFIATYSIVEYNRIEEAETKKRVHKDMYGE